MVNKTVCHCRHCKFCKSYKHLAETPESCRSMTEKLRLESKESTKCHKCHGKGYYIIKGSFELKIEPSIENHPRMSRETCFSCQNCGQLSKLYLTVEIKPEEDSYLIQENHQTGNPTDKQFVDKRIWKKGELRIDPDQLFDLELD